MLLVPTCVRPSPIHGVGLFAVGFIPKGAPVWRFEAGFDLEFTPEQLAAWPAVASEYVRRYGYAGPAGKVTLSGDNARFMNHSPSPNTGAPPDMPPPVTTTALRDIADGEEITCNYFDFDPAAARKLAPAAGSGAGTGRA